MVNFDCPWTEKLPGYQESSLVHLGGVSNINQGARHTMSMHDIIPQAGREGREATIKGFILCFLATKILRQKVPSIKEKGRYQPQSLNSEPFKQNMVCLPLSPPLTSLSNMALVSSLLAIKTHTYSFLSISPIQSYLLQVQASHRAGMPLPWCHQN